MSVTQRDPGIERGGDERMSERVGGGGLGDPGTARDLANDPPGATPVQPPLVRRGLWGRANGRTGKFCVLQP